VSYIKETGDFGILDELVPFDNDISIARSLFDHLTVSFDHVVNNLGPHGLPLIGRADWNDCLNLNCFSNDPNESFQTTENKTEGSKAESVMIAGLFVFMVVIILNFVPDWEKMLKLPVLKNLLIQW